MPTPEQSFRFTHAILRRPANSIVDGLRAIDTGTPDIALFREHHAAYQAALAAAGLATTVLEPLEEFPDSVFVEDAALCLPEGAVVLRPGAPSRLGEAVMIAPALREMFGDVRHLPALGDHGHGRIEGGDVLVTDREILVGRSARTNGAGIEALRIAVRDWGYTVRELTTPPDVLHFKTDCGLLDGDTILTTRRLAAGGHLDGYALVPVAEGEEAAANVVRINDVVLMPAGFPSTAETVRDAGYAVVELANSEAAKVDGGMSCLSLRFRGAD
ncbi:MAG: arginine deiminase family protein [Thalassobaculaceae bacterium]|nr:arginine deiminase family protein [Thalassobaculaceae bacterium]